MIYVDISKQLTKYFNLIYLFTKTQVDSLCCRLQNNSGMFNYSAPQPDITKLLLEPGKQDEYAYSRRLKGDNSAWFIVMNGPIFD